MPSRDDIRSLSTEQRWIPPSTVRRDALTPESRNDLIFRKVRGILNKLTPEKFAKLSNDLLNVELNSHVILKGVIFLVRMTQVSQNDAQIDRKYCRTVRSVMDAFGKSDKKKKGQYTSLNVETTVLVYLLMES